MKRYSYIIIFFSLAFLQDVQLSITNVDTTGNTLDIEIINSTEINSFDFELFGITIPVNGVIDEGTLVGDNDWLLTLSGNTILGLVYDDDATPIPAGEGILLSIEFTDHEDEIYFGQITFSLNGNILDVSGQPACLIGIYDCADECGGSAEFDECNACDDIPENDCIEDCFGEWGGTAIEDCSGECNGSFTLDNCGVCDDDPLNDCLQDCLGIWGGTAIEDCAGECNGLSLVDNCGSCDDNLINDCILGCTIEGLCNFDGNATDNPNDYGLCEEDNPICCSYNPGEIDSITTIIDLNSVDILWATPSCGTGDIITYYLVIDDTDEDGFSDNEDFLIGGTHFVDNLDWGTEFNWSIRTETRHGIFPDSIFYSNSNFNFSIGSEPIPQKVENLVVIESLDAGISLDWEDIDFAEYYVIYSSIVAIDTVEISEYIHQGIIVNAIPGEQLVYEYYVNAMNSQFQESVNGNTVSASPNSIPVVNQFEAISSPGEVEFLWEGPNAYNGIDEYLFQLHIQSILNNGNVNIDTIINNYSEDSYIVQSLQEFELVNLSIASVHEYGYSNISEVFSAQALLPPPPIVTEFQATSEEAAILLEWHFLQYPNHLVHLYRCDDNEVDGICDSLDLVLLPDAPDYSDTAFPFHSYYTDYGLVAGKTYEYQIAALNAEGLEGEMTPVLSASTNSIDIINDLEANSATGRVLLNWSKPDEYAGLDYIYQIVNNTIDTLDNSIEPNQWEHGEVIKTTTSEQTHIPNLISGQTYCFTVKSVLAEMSDDGELIYVDDQESISEESNISCSAPDSQYGEAFDWNVQIVTEFNGLENVQLHDIYNLIGVFSGEEFEDSNDNNMWDEGEEFIDINNNGNYDGESTDNFDSLYDLPEPPPFDSYVSLYFPHPEWIQDQGEYKYTQDIRSSIDLENAIIEWDAKLESNIHGNPSLLFYFSKIEENDLSVYFLRNDEIVKIEDGQRIDIDFYDPQYNPIEFKIVVGNALPEPPVNIQASSGYRQAAVTWEDACCEEGSMHYPASYYKVFRNGTIEIADSLLSTEFIDFGLEPETEYTYTVQAGNIAGLSDTSHVVGEIAFVTTLENRQPIADAGVNLIIYDMTDDNNDQIDVIFPVNYNFSISDTFFIDNVSFDPDNYFINENGYQMIYNPLLDTLSHTWSSLNGTVSNDPIQELTLGIGNKSFALTVNDGYENSTIDSVGISVQVLPEPAAVDMSSLIIFSRPYSMNINWIESYFTGETYADINGNNTWDASEIYNDCGIDGLCPCQDEGDSCGLIGGCSTDGDPFYTASDFGECNGIWDFIDNDGDGFLDNDEPFESWDDFGADGIPGSGDIGDNDGIWDAQEPFVDQQDDDGLYNGIYDSGNFPRPPYYGLAPNNNFESFLNPNNIASSYLVYMRDPNVQVDSQLMEVISDPDSSLSSEHYTFTYNADTNPVDFTSGLSPSTTYCFLIKSCNFNNDCSESEESCFQTAERPSVTILSPNGSEIFEHNELIEITLEYTGQEFIDSVSIYISSDGINYNFMIGSGDISLAPIQSLPVDISFLDGLYDNIHFQVKIIDEEGYTSQGIEGYSDVSDYPIVVSNGQMQNQYYDGWYIIGLPLNPINNSLNNNVLPTSSSWQIWDVEGNTASASSADFDIFSGNGYYLGVNEIVGPLVVDIEGNALSNFDLILNQGWNLISNPLVVSMNIGNIDFYRFADDSNESNRLSWNEALQLGLISSRLIEFNNQKSSQIFSSYINEPSNVPTHIPSNTFEPFKGYWIYSNEDNLLCKITNKSIVEDPVDDNDDSSWKLKLYSRAFNANQQSWGDYIEIGFAPNATNGYDAGKDELHFPTSIAGVVEYTNIFINHLDWVEQDVIEEELFYKDIRADYETSYIWDIVGILSQTSSSNPQREIELAWEMDELAQGYSIFLNIGNNQIDMNTLEKYIKVNSGEFSEMSISVQLDNYVSGCTDSSACNFICSVRPWECDENGELFNASEVAYVDDGSCENSSCLGCIDPLATNYNPSATFDAGNCFYNSAILLPLDIRDIYIEDEVVNIIPVNLVNWSNDESIVGVEIKIEFDSNLISINPEDICNHIGFDEYGNPFGGYYDGILGSGDALGYYNCYSDYSILPSGEISNSIIGIVIYNISGDPIISSGLLFNITPSVINPLSIGSTSDIKIISSQINLNEITNNNLQVNIVKGKFEVSGSINYYSYNQAYVNDASINLLGYSDPENQNSQEISSFNLMSNILGNFSNPSIDRGVYIIQSSKEGENDDGLTGYSPRGISSLDASLIARSTVGHPVNDSDGDLVYDSPFNVEQALAADVDHDGLITAVDASIVARYLVGLEIELNSIDLDWIFVPDDEFTMSSSNTDGNIYSSSDLHFNITNDINYELNDYFSRYLIEDQNNLNISAIRIGDVDGDWYRDTVVTAQLSRIDVSNFPIINVGEENPCTLPIVIKEGEYIQGIDIELEYNPIILSFDEIVFNEIIDTDNYVKIINSNIPGKILISLFSVNNIAYIDELVAEIKFSKIELSDKTMPQIILNKLVINSINSSGGFLIINNNESFISPFLQLDFNSTPLEYSLEKNYPNPFNPTTTLSFNIAHESNVSVSIYDIRGKFVDNVISDVLNIGSYDIHYDASAMSSGMYFVVLNASSVESNITYNATQKIILLK